MSITFGLFRRAIYGAGTAAGAYLGAEASGLSIDFTQNSALVRGHSTNYLGNVAGLLSFTRASSAWYFNSSGVLVSAASNALRFDYDPATLLPLGLLVEGQRTNLLLNSETLSTQSVTVTAAAHTLSFYGTGTVTLTGTSTAGPLVGTGANNRVTLTFTPTAGSLTLTVSGSVKYANLELGGFATSPIITVGSQVTRSADSPSLATTAFPFSAIAGTMVWEGSHNTDTTGYEWVLGSDASHNIWQYIDTLTPTFRGRASASTQWALAAANTVAAGTPFKTASAWVANDIALSKDGAAVVTDATATIPAVSTTMTIGRLHNGTFHINGYVRKLKYLPRRATNTEIQAMAA